jgi:putative ABC transport system substrate-binding protein
VTKRRTFILAAGALASLIACRVAAQSRDRAVRIGILSDAHEGANADLWAIFRKQLNRLGYVDGTGYVVDSRWAAGVTQQLEPLAAELAALKPHVIVADGTPSALAAKRATTSIPIVSIRISNPVKAGLAASLARPGGNVTGTTIITTDIVGKWLELLREIAPAIKSAAFLNDTTNAGAMLTFRELQGRARSLGMTVQALDGRDRKNVEQAFGTMMRERLDGLIVGTNAVVFEHRQQIIEAAARQRVVAIYARREYVEAGGLMSYGADLGVHYGRAADYVHRILRGTRPADLPIEQPMKFELVLNMKTAKELGITIPQSVLVRADRVIE